VGTTVSTLASPNQYDLKTRKGSVTDFVLSLNAQLKL